MSGHDYTFSPQLRARKYLLLLCALVFVSQATVFAQDQLSSQEIAAVTRPAVVTVTALSAGERIGFGSGFFIREDGVLLTNLHVVEGADSLQITLDSTEIYDNVFYIARDDRRDLVVLKIPATTVPTIPVGDDRVSVVGDGVYVLGSPLGFQGTFSDGLLSSKRTEDGVTYLQITAPISEGSSGGPVLNEQGEAIGVATSTFLDGQNLNLAIPARYGSGLLAVDADPILFVDIAHEFTTNGSGQPESTTLEPWEQQVLDYVIESSALFQDEGYAPLEDAFSYGELPQGEVGTLSWSLQPGQYVAMGVCDDDCLDLDLFVSDSNGDIIEMDVEDDAFPFAIFDVNRLGTYDVHADIVSCGAQFCGYAIQLFRALTQEQSLTTEQGTQTDPLEQQIAIEAMIRSQGLEAALQILATESQTPIEVDEVTTLALIEASGTQLRRTYVVESEGMTITEEFRTLSRNGICAYAPFEPILRARGTIREVYVETSGREIGSVLVTRIECGL